MKYLKVAGRCIHHREYGFHLRFLDCFFKHYVVPDGEKWNAVFNLNINPVDNTYYKNFALIITNDVDRDSEKYTEYGAIRFDVTNSRC